eukprot:2044211-Prymnesium_polylepis.1
MENERYDDARRAPQPSNRTKVQREVRRQSTDMSGRTMQFGHKRRPTMPSSRAPQPQLREANADRASGPCIRPPPASTRRVSIRRRLVGGVVVGRRLLHR